MDETEETSIMKIRRVSDTNLAEMLKTLPITPTGINLDFFVYGISQPGDLDAYLMQCREKRVMPFVAIRVSGGYLNNGKPYIFVSNSKFEIAYDYNASECQRAEALQGMISGGMVHRIEARIDTKSVCKKFLKEEFPRFIQKGYVMDSAEITFRSDYGRIPMHINKKDDNYCVWFDEGDLSLQDEERVLGSDSSKLLRWFEFWKDKSLGQTFLFDD